MKLNPTSGQTSRSMVHSARPLMISASSFASSGCSGGAKWPYALGERKKELLQRSAGNVGLCAQFVERANPSHLSSGEKNEAIASPSGVGQLMNGEHERAPFGGFAADHFNDVADLAKIEAIEWLVHEQHVVRGQKANRQQQTTIVAL